MNPSDPEQNETSPKNTLPPLWEFWIDVGGTFTDCIARSPDGKLNSLKTLSSGITKGVLEEINSGKSFRDSSYQETKPDFWKDYSINFLNEDGESIFSTLITSSKANILTLSDNLPEHIKPGTRYEIHSSEEAPVFSIRKILNLCLNENIPAVSVKLVTTKGTNALLTRTGCRTAFVTTKGFKDVLLIGNQVRPSLFDLEIKKPAPLFEQAIEIEERISSDGTILVPVSVEKAREKFRKLKEFGIESVAICFLHSFENPVHEQQVKQIAIDVGFTNVSVSSELSPLIKMVSRGDTTVVDAYLNPILSDYMNQIHASINQNAHNSEETDSSLKLMTSAGGLVDHKYFKGKDSILSGPAGGVIGYSRISEQAGFKKAIGFDMGGTSTDVSRYNGEYEYEFETEKAGVRIVSPMLSIETVAAGGGSICGFDGVKLFVGPQSAGADPGPACYGRGGPLTVTDLNFYLGKIISDQFPFQLDQSSVEKHLQNICDEIEQSPLGKSYSPIKLAEGFLEIANVNIVRAIRKISVSKGYDPSEYVLVTFGGAGAQHSCSIARSLGMKKILIHPFAGVLSAYGMGLADVRRFAEKNILKVLDKHNLEKLKFVFDNLFEKALSEVRSEKMKFQKICKPVKSLELRYQGTESVIQIHEPADGNYVSVFENQHLQEYGYIHSEKPIEIVTARVEVVGKVPHVVPETKKIIKRQPVSGNFQNVWFNHQEHRTPVFFREELHPGDEITGPAIICEKTSTIVIDPDFQCLVTERNEIVLTQIELTNAEKTNAEKKTKQELSEKVDPVQLEIFNNLFASIAEQMGTTLQKTSFSTNIKERLDFSCALFSPVGDLVVNAPHIPVHLGAMSETVKSILKENSSIEEGDVFVTNDPYRGGSHLPDITVVTPVHDTETGKLIFLTASRAHHSEIGGIVPGSMPPFSRNLLEEGILIRNFKMVSKETTYEKKLSELLLSGPYPSRAVHENLSDISAQIAANAIGVQQIKLMIRKYSLPVVQAYMNYIQRAATEKMKQALLKIPDGQYSFTDHLDDGSPVSVCVRIQGNQAEVDFSGTGPVLSSNLNANHAIVKAAVLYVFRCLIKEEIPLNSGVLEPVKIILPECLLNPPEKESAEKCAAMVGGNVETSQRVVDVLLGALGMAAASQGTMNNLSFGDDTFGYYETICGGSGATRNSDGADAVHTHMTNTRLTDIEILERRYPVRVQEFSIRQNSGGNGEHHGGDGIIRELEFLKSIQVAMLSERREKYAPFGLEGGNPSELGENSLIKSGESDSEDLGGKFSIQVEAGDILRIQTPGGGGFGSPEKS